MYARLTILLSFGLAMPALAQTVPGPTALDNDYVLVSRNSEPAIVNWPEPMIHMVKNIGDMALRNFILEFQPAR